LVKEKSSSQMVMEAPNRKDGWVFSFVDDFVRIIKVGKDLQGHQAQPSTQPRRAC